MSKILWSMVGIKTEVNGLNEAEYTLKCSYGVGVVIHILYTITSMVMPCIVGTIALNDGGVISGIGATLTWIVTLALIPILTPIIEGYGSSYKILW